MALDVFTEEHQPIIVTTPTSSGDLKGVSGIENHDGVSLLGQHERRQDSRQTIRRIPLFAWPLLLASLASVSSAGVVFALPEVPTFTLAAWRLQTTGFLLIPGAVYQYVNVPAGDRQRFHRSVLLILASGAFLAIHFSFWVMAIHHTSLTHALLIASAPPLLIAMGLLVLRKPISLGEVLGTCMGMGGVLLLTGSQNKDGKVTLTGDLSALMTAVFFCGYIVIGSHMQKWLPLFLYASPVTNFAAFLVSFAAVMCHEAAFTSPGNAGLFGWTTDKSYLYKIVYLAIVPGLIGHTGLNALLKWMPALLVSLALTSTPLMGTFIGWYVGVARMPGVWTYCGGTILLMSTISVIIAGDRRENAAAGADADSAGSCSPKDFGSQVGKVDPAIELELAEKV